LINRLIISLSLDGLVLTILGDMSWKLAVVAKGLALGLRTFTLTDEVK
jgi:hypothetical protein